MKTINCDICNGKIEIVDEGKGVCVNCGITYSVDRLRQKFNTANNTTGTNSTSSDTQLFQTGKFEIIDNVLVKYHGQLSSVKIPNGVTKIKNGAFEDCNFVEEITIPGSVKEIETSAFTYNTRHRFAIDLKKLIFEEGVEKLDRFTYSTENHTVKKSLQVVLPKSLKFIDPKAFWFEESEGDYPFTPEYIFPNGKSKEIEEEEKQKQKEWEKEWLCPKCSSEFEIKHPLLGKAKQVCPKCGYKREWKY